MDNNETHIAVIKMALLMNICLLVTMVTISIGVAYFLRSPHGLWSLFLIFGLVSVTTNRNTDDNKEE